MSVRRHLPRGKIAVCLVGIAKFLTDPCFASDDQAVCGLAKSSAPYEFRASTKAGVETIRARRQGDTILIDGQMPHGPIYRLRRRNGFDLDWQIGDRRRETAYPQGLTDTPIGSVLPKQYIATETILQNGKVTGVVHRVIKAAIIGKENVQVGACSFETVHLVDEEVSRLPSYILTVSSHRWFSSGLGIFLRTISARRKPDGSWQQFYTSDPISISYDNR